MYENEKGEKYILSKNGEKMFIKTDAKGNMYYETADGKKVAVNATSLNQEIIIMKENGEMLIRGKDGKI